jgi:formate dehydrogenase major subunit
MEMKRRSFLALAGAVGTGGMLKSFFGIDLAASAAYAGSRPPVRGKVTTTICPFCSVGCGMLVTTVDGKVVDLSGDPDHPINEAAMCSKGAAVSQIWNSDQRATKVLYRAPGASDWQEKDWDFAMARIAERVKKTRDETFQQRDQAGRIVNRTMGIGSLGGSAMDNEECYALAKYARSIGTVYLEHHARL